MSRTKGNGLDAANDQPAKTHTKNATDFIAHKQKPARTGEQLSFLPPLPFCPAWPTSGTLAALALERLMNGDLLTHVDFIGACGSWRLAAVVFKLRALGWPVEAIEIPSPTTQSNRRIAVYELPAKYTALALAGGSQ